MTWGRVCILCGRTLPRRWWQRGLLAPMPFCDRADARTCQEYRYPPLRDL